MKKGLIILGVGITLCAICLYLSLGVVESSETGKQKLLREEQIEIMIKCISDANLTLFEAEQTYYINSKGKNRRTHLTKWGSYQLRASVALAFFQYRTKDR